MSHEELPSDLEKDLCDEKETEGRREESAETIGEAKGEGKLEETN